MMKVIFEIVVLIALVGLVLVEYVICCKAHRIEEEIDRTEMCRTLKENEVCDQDCELCYWRKK